MTKTLDPKNDAVFKIWMSDRRNRRGLIALLNAVIKPASPITAVKILNPTLPRNTTIDKGPILDLRARLNDGTHVHIEMQLSHHDGLRQRKVYYLTKTYSAQLGKGQDYAKLAPTIGIFFLDFNELKGRRFHSTFRLLEIHDHQPLTDSIELHVLELKKLPKGPPDAEADPVLRWCKFFAAKSDEEREQLAMIDPEIREAKTELERISKSPIAQRLAEDRQLEINAYRNTIQRAKKRAAQQAAQRAKKRAAQRVQEAHAKGEAKGRVEGERRLLLRQLRLKFGELTESAKGRIHEANEQQLNTWAERLLTAASIDEVLNG